MPVVPSASLFRHTVSIRRPTNTSDASGGITQGFADVYAGYKAAIQMRPAWITERDSVEAAKAVPVTHQLFFATDISGAREGDKVVVTASPVTAMVNAIYTVQSVADMGDKGRAWCLYAKEDR